MKGLLLNGKPYTGSAVYINGYNGYTKSKGDSVLCAIINNSAFSCSGEPNALRDENGNVIHDENKRGQTINNH